MKRKTTGELIFQVFNLIFLTVLVSLILVLVLNIMALSVSNREAILSRAVTIFPVGFNAGAYREVISHFRFIRSLINTVGITVAGTVLAIVITLMVAYSLTKDFVGKKFVTYFFIFTMYFGGGLIPTYIVYTNYYNLRNNMLVLFLPGLVSTFYIIVMRSQIDALPSEVFDAATIDGAKETQMLLRIVLPMISPTIAAISMFFALGFWNSWFSVMVYITNEDMWTLQYFLRVVVLSRLANTEDASQFVREVKIPEENFRMAAIVLVAAPIVMIYPFVQKYFVKGILSGAVKG